jgi:hypothetical protein
VGDVLVPADLVVQAFFDTLVSVEVGDGTRALFWENNCLTSCSIKLLAPNIVRRRSKL